jgi:hypothetical protein
MAREVRTQMLRVAEREWITFAFELLNDPILVDYRLGDDGIGQQLVCNNRLFLIYRTVCPKDPVASEVKMRGTAWAQKWHDMVRRTAQTATFCGIRDSTPQGRSVVSIPSIGNEFI